jgi:hypothetical protein
MTEELRDKVRTLGLDRLTEEHLAQFERGTTGMGRHLQRLPRGMPAAQTCLPSERGNAPPPVTARFIANRTSTTTRRKKPPVSRAALDGRGGRRRLHAQ